MASKPGAKWIILLLKILLNKLYTNKIDNAEWCERVQANGGKRQNGPMPSLPLPLSSACNFQKRTKFISFLFSLPMLLFLVLFLFHLLFFVFFNFDANINHQVAVEWYVLGWCSQTYFSIINNKCKYTLSKNGFGYMDGKVMATMRARCVVAGTGARVV